MIHSARPAPEGTIVELRRGEHAIVARVMWRDGTRLGLQSDERLPVEEILSLSQTQSLRLVADEGVLIERRKCSRLSDHSRLQGRAMQFAGIAVIGVSLAVSIWAMAERAFAQPLAVVAVALAGQP